MRSTAMVSSVKRTSFTRSPGPTSEACIPFLQQGAFVFLEHALYTTKFHRTESKVPSQCDGLRPELGRLIVTIHVHVRWFVGFVTVEVDALRT
jgi:hypothetical protein